jgi:hypothetical protein
LKTAINTQLRIKLADSLKENALVKKRITELKNQIDILEEKYILDKVEAAVYEKFHSKYSKELGTLETELSKNHFESSNLENIIDKGLEIARNLSTAWASSDFDNKQKLQYLVFPEGIRYCKGNDTVQTPKINSLFCLIPLQVRLLAENKKGNFKKNCPKSSQVTLLKI